MCTPAAATMISQARASFANVNTRTLTVGAGGTPIVLLHGYADSADTWRPVLSRLEAAGRHAINVDLPGFGHAEFDSIADAPSRRGYRPALWHSMTRSMPGTRSPGWHVLAKYLRASGRAPAVSPNLRLCCSAGFAGPWALYGRRTAGCRSPARR
jgi:alpha-beta hydrolase superfamily lysophospholipase